MYGERLQSAVLWAAQLHSGQWRDGDVPVPYVCHPLEVLTLLRYVGGVTDEDLLLAAVLHDILEETVATREEIEAAFGMEVAQLVSELTRSEPTQSDIAGLGKDEIWELRSSRLLAEIRSMSPRAQTVKLCDRLSNLRESAYTKRGKKRKRYVAQTWKILDIVPRSTNPALWDAVKAEAACQDARP